MRRQLFSVEVSVDDEPTFACAVFDLLSSSPGVLSISADHPDSHSVTVTIEVWSQHLAYQVVAPKVMALAGRYPASATSIMISPVETAPSL